MQEERHYQHLKHLEIKEKRRIRKFRRIQADKRRKNTRNRKKTYEREYNKHYRAMLALNKQASSAVTTIHEAKSLSNSFAKSANSVITSALGSHESNSNSYNPLASHEPVVTPKLLAQRSLIEKINHQKDIQRINKQSISNQYEKIREADKLAKQKEVKIQKQTRQIKLNQMKIEYQRSTLHQLTSKFSSVISKYRKSFENVAKDTINSVKKSLRQTRLQTINSERASTSVSNPVISNAISKLKSKASNMPDTFFGKMRANFYKFKINRASSSALQSLNDSVAAPIQSKHDSWISTRDSLNLHVNDLYYEDYHRLLRMNSEKPPMDSEAFSNAIESATGMNLVQYSTSASVSKSASESRAKPIKQEKHAKLMKSLNAEHVKKMKIVRKKDKHLKDIEKTRNHQQEVSNYWKNKLFNYKYSHNSKFRKRVDNIRRNNNRGPVR